MRYGRREARTINHVALVTSSILAAAMARAGADADAPGSLTEVIVTAQKRAEDLQAVPLSVQVLDNNTLAQLQATSFDEYAKYLPSISAINFGPGLEQLAIRGVNNGYVGSPVGSLPTVAIYLDEQPVTTIARNLDVHIYDIARVEELSGPQGTLFGASSMAGTLRIITNPPSTKGFEAGYDVNGNLSPNASPGDALEGFVNLPLTSQAAVRLVAFDEHDGGFINNVPGSETYPTSGVTVSNAALVRRHFNDVSTSGGRAALKIDLTDSWTLTPSLIAQDQTAHGIPAYTPSLGDLNVTRYFPEHNDNDWWQAALVVEGKIGNLDVVYAGGYLRWDTQAQSDYSAYAYDYDVYYQSMPQYWGDLFRNDAGQLIPPAEYTRNWDRYSKLSQELRLSSARERRLRFVAGLFLQHQVDDTRFEQRIDGLGAAYSITGEPGVYYLNAMSRIDRDRAAFGELSYDLTRDLTLTAGLREFEYDNSVYGFFGYPWTEALCAAGSAAIAGPGRPCIDVNQRAARSGSTYKVNLTYRLDADHLLYGTWSTGFRPGGINRTFDVGPYHPDYLMNLEAGWKSEWLSHRLRFNGAAFFERWKSPQFDICGPGCILEVINAGGADVRGLESQLEWSVTSALTLSASGTWLDPKLTDNACKYGNAGSLCNNATGVADPTVMPIALAGSQLPAPKFTGNAIARYAFPLGRLAAHLQAAVTGRTALPTQLPPQGPGLVGGPAPPYASLDLSGGLARDSWSGELYLTNAFNRRAEENRGLACAVATCGNLYVMPIPPLTVGVWFRQRF